MAETIATLSLVCNAMQVISFTGEVIQLYRSISKDGCPEPSVASNMAHFSALVASLQERTNEYDPICSNAGDELSDVKALRQARTKLNDIASSLVKDTQKLQKLLGKVATPSTAGRLRRVATVFKYKIYYQTPISSLEKRIDETRDILNSELLGRTCSSLQASHCRSEERYTNLDGEIKRFINHWSEGKRTISELILSEAQSTRAHVTAEAEHTRDRIDSIDTRLLSEFSRRNIEGTRDRVLSTLWFPEINQRENVIAEATDDIVHEIFPKSKFADWLQSDQPIFWISGKPGSGKSTLTKYLTQSSQTVEFLQTQRPSVQILRFYFYELGNNQLQRQLLGCLRTLLHQILEDDLDILERLLQVLPGIGRKMSEHDWSLKELFNSLVTCLRGRTTASCLFLDGLDEIQVYERVEVVELVKSLGSIPNVKICTTSRPENIFTQHLESYPCLRVQEITNLALYSYAEKGLQGYSKDSGRSEGEFRTLLENIVRKSEGVFLWTVMVINSLARGIENGDSWELLQQRVTESAPGLNELFKQIWNRQNLDLPIYKKEAARIFWHTLNSVSFEEQQSLRHYLIATHQDFRGHLQQLITTQDEPAFVDGGASIIQQYVVWLSARSAGLLEIEEPKSLLSSVDFIHRSVREFFESTQDGKHILDHDDESIKGRQVAYNHATREVAYIHITTAMFLAQTPANIKRPITVKTLRMLGQRLCRIDGSGSERYQRWIPPPDQSLAWMQMVFHISAIAGDLSLLDHMDQTGGILDRSSQQEMGNVLHSCCMHMGISDLDGQTFIKTTTEGGNLSPLEGAIIITRRKLNCIEWLLNHGADPHMAREDNYPTTMPQLTAKHATAFEIFILAAIPNLLCDASVRLASTQAKARTMPSYLAEIIGFLLPFQASNFRSVSPDY
ncbi:hypothetical protein GGS26DRAFT_568444 [Hypomontagnella submonticulosa]|nr:hypothetical protein GGS26DRAFT_568444 [Hypomontagnella submonticulosa]